MGKVKNMTEITISGNKILVSIPNGKGKVGQLRKLLIKKFQVSIPNGKGKYGDVKDSSLKTTPIVSIPNGKGKDKGFCNSPIYAR